MEYGYFFEYTFALVALVLPFALLLAGVAACGAAIWLMTRVS